MQPSDREFWRIANASSNQFLQLQVHASDLPKKLQLISLDGVALDKPQDLETIVIPPAGRAEFIVPGPPAGEVEQFVNLGFDTGPGGDFNPPVLLATVTASTMAPARKIPVSTRSAKVTRFANLASQTPTAERKLYFSEDDSGAFYITVQGQTPKVYNPDDPPSIVTHEGAVEDWILENRSTEVHAFHIHQIHFLLMEKNGQPVPVPSVRDTVVVPYWDGVSPQYPSIKVRMDFRDPEIQGIFLYHCHILDHEDGGMMSKIQVLPAN